MKYFKNFGKSRKFKLGDEIKARDNNI